jgi:hypothetical protein
MAPPILLAVTVIFFPRASIPLVISTWKFMVIAVALTVGAFARAASNVIRSRKDHFCIHCGYSLEGLPDGHRCPECGEPYLWRLIDEYRRDPAFFVQRHKALRTLPPPDHAPFNAGARHRKRSRDGT